MTAFATTSAVWLTPRRRTFTQYLALAVTVLAVSLLLTDPAYAQAADGVTSMAENIKTWLPLPANPVSASMDVRCPTIAPSIVKCASWRR